MGNGTDQIVTSYTYDPVTRELLQISYNDGTHAVSYGDPTDWDNRSNVKNRDRLGRVRSVIDALGTRTLGYDVAGQLESESIGNMNLVRDIDDFGRPEGFELKEGTLLVQNIDYGYDARGRFSTVDTQSDIFTYTWADGADLLTGYSSAGGLPAVSVAYTYEDNRDLKTDVVNKSLGADVNQYVYVYDEIGRRKQRTDNTTLVNKFNYNERSEVVEADMDGTTGFENVYTFDDIGNRTAVSGDGGTTEVTYVPDDLNQYDTVGGTTFNHDFDGNLTSDGGWIYTWNAENRLVEMESSASVSLADRQKLEFKYDFMGRRYSKKVYSYNTTTSAFDLQTTTTFVYDGWNMIHETTMPQSPALPVTRFYVWGLDLSQTLQGAGGVGGLLCSVRSQSGSAQAYYATADANGNITDYVNESGTVVASYSYDAFGKTITATESMASDFNFRFSSKYWDSETGLSYYGFRYYSADMGRWLNRDPIEEQDGANVYAYILNQSVNYIDVLGKEMWVGETTGIGGGSFMLKGGIQRFVLTGPCKLVEWGDPCKCEEETVHVTVMLYGVDAGLGVSLSSKADISSGDWSYAAFNLPRGSSASNFEGSAEQITGPSLNFLIVNIESANYFQFGDAVFDQDYTEELNTGNRSKTVVTGVGVSFASKSKGSSKVTKKTSKPCECPDEYEL